MTQNYIGCDISKDRLDVFDPRIGHATAHANSPAGIRALLKTCKVGNILIFEGEALAAIGATLPVRAQTIRSVRSSIEVSALSRSAIFSPRAMATIRSAIG